MAATGGLAFRPASLHDALRLCELETVQALRARPPPERAEGALRCRAHLSTIAARKVYDDIDATPGKEEPLMASPVAKLQTVLGRGGGQAQAVAEAMETDGGGGGEGSAGTAGEAGDKVQNESRMVDDDDVTAEAPLSREGSRRLMSELRALARDPHPNVSVYPSEGNLRFWRVLVEGPAGSTYAHGCWLGWLKFPRDYPSSPPEFKLVTPIRHCNINAHGR